MARPGVSWEVLRRSARRLLAQRFERGATVVGCLGPLLICGWTVARPFDLRQSYHHLLQCFIWLAAWYVLFAVVYVVLVWQRPRRHREGEDLAHLPLSAAHHQLQRALELGLVPLRCLLLTLPLLGIVFAYIGIPYGEQWSSREWSWSTGDEVQLLWLARVAWATVNLVTATLLPLAVALAISETVRSMLARVLLLVFPALGLYALLRFYDEHFRMPYRTDNAYSAFWFLLLPMALALLSLAFGQLRPWQRVAALLAMICIAGACFTAMRSSHPTVREFRQSTPVRQAVRSAWGSAAWLAGSLSPPRNVRLVMDRLQSNVLLGTRQLPPEPEWPFESDYVTNGKLDQAAFDRARQEHERLLKEYERAVSSQPRIALWFGAGLMPLLLPLLLLAGLLLGAYRRGFERADT